MKAKAEYVALLLGIGLLCTAALAQKPSPQQNMTVVVVNAHVQPSQPLQALRVSLSYLDGTSRITDARNVTNSHGEAFLQVSPDTAQRGDIRIEVTGATDLVIYQPADGQLSAVPTTVTIQLLPKGSAALLGPSQIEAMLHRSLLQLGSLQQQNRLLKQEIAQGTNLKQGLDDALAEWAKTNGFDPTEVDQHVQEWAKEIQARAERASDQQKALAELALKHYGIAGQLFEKAEDANADADPEEEEMMKHVRARSRSVLSNAAQAASAFQLNLQFHEATIALEHAADHAAAMHKKYPEDILLWAFWVQTTKSLAGARVEEGAAASASTSLPLLVQAAEDYELVAAEYQTVGERDDAADTEDSLGYTLWNAGTRAPADKAMALLDQSVHAYQHALEVRTEATRPKDWAITQNNLAVALTAEADRAPGEKARLLLDQAVQALQRVVQVNTRTAHPQDWGIAQNNLGGTLRSEGILTPGDKGLALFDQAAQAFQSALQVFTKSDQPREWARVQNNLGTVLEDEGQRLPPEKAVPLWGQAIQALRNALEVYTMSALPQAWATTENNLGLAFSNQAKITPDDKAAFDLFDQAALAYQNSLKVYTKADLPQDWARSEDNMGVAMCAAAQRAPADDAKTLFGICAQAYQNALQVYTKADRPEAWATIQNSLGIAFDNEAQRLPPDQAVAFHDQSVQAYRAALEVYTRTASPQDWADTENNLGLVLCQEAQGASADRATALFEQSAQAYRSALEAYVRNEQPWNWGNTQFNLGLATYLEAQIVSPEKATQLVDASEQAFQNSLQIYTREHFPREWGTTQGVLGIVQSAQGKYPAALKADEAALEVYPGDVIGTLRVAEANLTLDQFDACLKQAAAVENAQLVGPNAQYLLVRDSVKLACQWGAGDKASAAQTEKSLSSRGAQVFTSWNSLGARRYLSTSAAFETGRSAWIAIFAALQKADGSGVAAALHQLEPLMRP